MPWWHMQKVVERLHLKYTAAMIHSVHMSFNKFVKEQLKKVVFQIFLQYFILYWVMLKKEKL